ncbi:MAG: sigma-70 family RNA polymerase sigma factor [Myxococcota bacterium]
MVPDADQAEDDRLRLLFASAFGRGRPADDCPAPDVLLDAVHAVDPPEARAAVIDHLAVCAVCAEAWRLATLRRDDPQAIDADLRDKLSLQVRRVCPRWLREQQEDLVQTAMVKLIRTTSDRAFDLGFLRRVAYSVVVDEIRRQRCRSETAMSPSLPDRIASSADLSPETVARGAEIGEELLAALETLSVDRRRAVTLYLQDHAVPDVASLLGCDRKRASNLVYRGLADLRDALRARGVVP